MNIVRHPRRTVYLAAIAVVISAVLTFIVAELLVGGSNAKLRDTLEQAAITLVFGAILGGVVKVLLEDFDLGRVQRGEQAQFVSNVLDELKQVYDRVERARILLPAHRSAKTYGDEMRDLISSQVQLRNVVRALERRTDAMNDYSRETVRECVEEMERYLRSLTDEFRAKYKPIADKQRAYEAWVNAQLKKQDAYARMEDEGGFPNEAWDDITQLPQVCDFVGLRSATDDGEREDVLEYTRDFCNPLSQATEILRGELYRIYGRG